MTDIQALKEKISQSGMTMVFISKQSGIDRATLYNKLNGKSEFTVSDIVGLSKVLHFTKSERDHIFFGK